MNWLQNIRNILGSFWGRLFGEPNFIHGVENLTSLMGKSQQANVSKSVDMMLAADNTARSDFLPFVIYVEVLDYSTVTPEGHPSSLIEDLCNGAESGVGLPNANLGWSTTSLYPIPTPLMITDHTVDYKRTFFNGIDFAENNGDFTFYMDITKLGLTPIAITTSNGSVKPYYRLFGWKAPDTALHDIATAFYSQRLNPWAEDVNALHQLGGTVYNVKKLLADVSESVICEADGTIAEIWTEQGYTCIRVDDRVYMAKPGVEIPTNITIGATVKRGDTLAGSLRDIDVTNMSDIPGRILVQTDVGAMYATNRLDPYNATQLSLDGKSSEQTVAYENRCATLMEAGAPVVHIPQYPTAPGQAAQTNPACAVFALRRGRVTAMTMNPVRNKPTAEAIDCIQKNVCVTGMMYLDLRDSSDTVDVELDFVSEASMLAVAEAASITVIDMVTEARTFA